MLLFTLLEHRVDKKFEDKAEIFKDDIKSLKEYIDKVFATKEDFAKLRGELPVVKWMLGLVLAGILSLIVKTFF